MFSPSALEFGNSPESDPGSDASTRIIPLATLPVSTPLYTAKPMTTQPSIATLHRKITPRPIRTRVFLTSKGKIWSSPNVDEWPQAVDEDGPLPLDENTRSRRLSSALWQIPGFPGQAMLPRQILQPAGILGSIAPMHSLEWDYERLNGGWVLRRGHAWAHLDRKLLLIAEALHTHFVLGWDATIPQNERPIAPSWYIAPQPDGDVAFQAGNAQITRLVNLAATVSLYCAIAWALTGDYDAWLAALEQKAGMTSADNRQWLNEMRGSWICDFAAKKHLGVFIDASTWRWPNLLYLFVQLRVCVMVNWGSDESAIRDLNSFEFMPECFRPSAVQMTSASLISSQAVERGTAAGALCNSLR
jgi:hypothetical protein